MTKNLGTMVSRVLETEDRSFNGVIFQQKRPPLDSECILSQDISLDKIAEVLKKTSPSGFLQIGEITCAPEDREVINSAWRDALVFNNPLLIVNGWIVKIGGGTNQLQPSAQDNIWKQLSNSTEEVAFIGEDSPFIGYREDLVFIEVWQKLISPSDPLYKYGFVQSALTANPNDLIDPNIEIETTKRVQIQYRFRWVKGIDFASYRYGLGFPGCFARGPLSIENENYIYTQSSTDPGLWISGNGSTQSQTDLDTVDGYIYAVPVARIHRRNRRAFSNTNLNGSAISILDGAKSDRPDGLFYDEINIKDVEDLRHKISLDGWDYNRLLEENLHLLWSKQLQGELQYNPMDENLFGRKLIYVDGISTQTRPGIDDTNRDPDGTARVYSEAKMIQKVSLYASSTLVSGGKVWFTPKGHKENSWEYELFTENRYYISSTEPVVKVYDETAQTITQLYGGTWVGLDIYKTWDYLSGNRNKIMYTPTNVTLVQGKKVVFEFEFIVREGGGIGATVGGFTHQINQLFYGHNDKDNKLVDFNLYNEDSHTITLDSPRTIGIFTDHVSYSRSIHHFESAANPASTSKSKYKAAVVELVYYKQSAGGSSDTIPATLYGRSVLSILSVFNINASFYFIPTIVKQGDNSFKLDGITADEGDILEYTLLLGDYTIDYVPYTRGIKNIAKTYNFSISISVGGTTGIINAKEKNPLCDGILACAGFYDGINYKYVGYINNRMVLIDTIEGLGSALIKFTLSSPSPYSGSISIPCLGYYAPATSDLFYFIYDYIPYQGISRTRLVESEIQQVKILKMDERILITTAGTGSETQLITSEYKNLVEALPLNKKLLEYNLFGDNIVTPVSGGESAIRRVFARGVSNLREGVTLNLKLGTDNTEMLRGVIIDSPIIQERGLDLSPSVNHVTQWSAIVEGKGELWGELFLMVITTFSSIYNSTEGLDYEYLEQKGIYKDGALGKGSETIIDNAVSDLDLSQNLGEKIYGAVDLFSLKNRPTIIPTM